MAVIHWRIGFVLLAAGTVFSTSSELDTKEHNDDVEVGNWTVGDCIMAKFSMEFTINTGNKGNYSKISLPPSAVAAKDNNGTLCSKDINKVQTLTLSWKEKQQNDTKIELSRFIQVS